MARLFKYGITALGPVFLAWILGIFTLPESTFFLDYSSGGSELMDLSDELKKKVRVFVGKEQKEKLSLYSVHFINRSAKHFEKMEVSFLIDSKNDTELIASTLHGPENYPDGLIHKESEGKNEIVFVLDHINRAGTQPRNYFTASFLFSGAPPDGITPISHAKGIEFRPANENTKDIWLMGLMGGTFLVLYIWFIWWITKRSNIKLAEKKELYAHELRIFLQKEFALTQERAASILQEIERVRDRVYKSPGVIRKFIRKMVEES